MDSRPRLVFVTAATMAIGTFPIVVFSVLAADLIEEFDVQRWQIGLLVTANAVVGAFLSPVFGSLTDRLGANRSTAYVLITGAGAIGLISLSPTYLLLIGATLLSGIPQGWCNPASNALIVQNVPEGRRGVITGIKQSGVQFGIFLGGALLPILATGLGWRLGLATFIVIPLAGLLGVRPGANVRGAGAARNDRGELSSFVNWVSIYGFLSGGGSSAMLAFLPLFAEEDQLWDPVQAGWLVAGIGLVGIGARIGWGAVSHSWFGHGKTLFILALISAGSATMLALAAGGVVDTWVLVPGALLLGAGAVAWNSVGMLAVMDYSPASMVGRGTGRVLLGFLLGLAVGPPVMGFSVDRLDSYLAGWVTIVAIFLISAIAARRVKPPLAAS